MPVQVEGLTHWNSGRRTMCCVSSEPRRILTASPHRFGPTMREVPRASHGLGHLACGLSVMRPRH